MIVSQPQVRSGAPDLAYVEAGVPSTVNTGVNSYEGCNRYQATELRQPWTRADGTTFQEIVGAGTPVGPSYACTTAGGSNINDWIQVAKWIGYANLGGAYCGQVHEYYCPGYFAMATHKATRTVTREDGAIVSTQTAEKTYECWRSVSGVSDCPAWPSAQAVATWRAELGW